MPCTDGRSRQADELRADANGDSHIGRLGNDVAMESGEKTPLANDSSELRARASKAPYAPEQVEKRNEGDTIHALVRAGTTAATVDGPLDTAGGRHFLLGETNGHKATHRPREPLATQCEIAPTDQPCHLSRQRLACAEKHGNPISRVRALDGLYDEASRTRCATASTCLEENRRMMLRSSQAVSELTARFEALSRTNCSHAVLAS